MSVLRLMGTETEYAVSDFEDSRSNPMQLPFEVVAGAADPSTQGIRWDYGEEDPTHDARGMRLSRAAAPASMLTDAPQLHITNVIAPNGGRIYVDHAHPEYSAPETNDPFMAVRYDHAGDALMEQAAIRAGRRTGRQIQLHRNNVDGKGASWGTHENYQMLRSVPFAQVQGLMTAHFVTRQIYAGSGRVGIGERSETPGFQLSQRADYIHSRIGLQTTFERPIINTRDESHSTDEFRRLHVIVGDANRMDVPQVLKLGTTSMLLWMLEMRMLRPELNRVEGHMPLDFVDPVEAMHIVSHDLGLSARLALDGGEEITALEMQRRLLEAVERTGSDVYGRRGGDSSGIDWPDPSTERVMHMWREILSDLCKVRDAGDEERLGMRDEASRIEWLAKWQLLHALEIRIRHREHGRMPGTGVSNGASNGESAESWSDPRLRALDLAWSAVDSGKVLFARMQGRLERTVSDDELRQACAEPPQDTRAWLRARLVRRFPTQIIGVAWARMTVRDDRGGDHAKTLRLDMRDSSKFGKSRCEAVLQRADSAAEAVEMLAAEPFAADRDWRLR
ncbi:MAG: depupylase/deamidase Dop [Bifidobacterium sp.]|uniref:depupylase/deamidase Dop n=1 Tax=Bifidobacterium sp. TaxID=41200 RepID=UPI0039EA4F55